MRWSRSEEEYLKRLTGDSLKYELAVNHELETANRCSLMNNTKWRRFFQLIKDSGVCVQSSQYANVLNPEHLVGITPELEPGQLSCTLDDCNGPVRFREILYMQMVLRTDEDLKKLTDSMDKAGQYEYTTENNHTLILYGYK